MPSSLLRSALASSVVLGLLLAPAASAVDEADWDQERVATLAAELHESVKGLRDEIRSVPRDIGTMKAWAYHRLMDELRLIERETHYLHNALESGRGREETKPTYARIAVLRRDCAEEMRKLFLGTPALERLARAQAIVEQMDPYYGFDPERADHERVLER